MGASGSLLAAPRIELPVNVTRNLNHGGQILVTGTISVAQHDVKAEQKRIVKIRNRRQ
jgi:hypothetical protein